jgi:phytoene desaturase
MKKVIIIGAGLGGLAAALRLRHRGFDVIVLEKLPRPGGRSNVIEEDGFRLDTGPTIIVMKEMFDETYRSIGLDINQRLEFQLLDPNYRMYFHDGTSLDVYGDMARLSAEVEKVEPGAAVRLFQFLGEGAKKYDLAMADFVMRNYDHITDLVKPALGIRMLRTGAHENLYKQVSRFFQSDKLRKVFSFHSLFVGLSPFDALAMYSLITYADLAQGMHYPTGGVYRIVEDMVRIAEETGVQVSTRAAVADILVDDGAESGRSGRPRAVGVRLESGEELRADIVVSNADLPYTYRKLVPARYRRHYPDSRLDRMEYSCSGYMLYLGLDQLYPHMRHQALYFSHDYRGNFDAIFRTKTLPEDPSFHINYPSVTDPSLAPPGHSVLYILVPMPNLQAKIDWQQAGPTVREQVLAKLERIIAADIRQHIVWERDCAPSDWERDLNAVEGTAFGSLSQGFFQSTYFRPHNKARDIDGLYFVGQGTYPGIGTPMVLISARLLEERLVQEWL